MRWSIPIDYAPFKEKRAAQDMVGTIRTAQEAETNGVLNRDTPPKGPRPTAKGKDLIQRGDVFMEDWPLHVMETYMDGLKEGKERTVLLACIKRKEGGKISTIANEMRKSPNTARGRLARGGTWACTTWTTTSRLAGPRCWTI